MADFAFRPKSYVVKYHSADEHSDVADGEVGDDRFGPAVGSVIAKRKTATGALVAARRHAGKKLEDANSEYGKLYHTSDEEHPHHGGSFYSVHERKPGQRTPKPRKNGDDD